MIDFENMLISQKTLIVTDCSRNYYLGQVTMASRNALVILKREKPKTLTLFG